MYSPLAISLLDKNVPRDFDRPIEVNLTIDEEVEEFSSYSFLDQIVGAKTERSHNFVTRTSRVGAIALALISAGLKLTAAKPLILACVLANPISLAIAVAALTTLLPADSDYPGSSDSIAKQLVLIKDEENNSRDRCHPLRKGYKLPSPSFRFSHLKFL